MNEQQKNISELKYTLVLMTIGFIVLAIELFRERAKTPIVKLVPVQAPIPSQREIQQRLKDTGKKRYDPGKIDGIIGTESRTAWDNYSCDQFAKRAIEGE